MFFFSSFLFCKIGRTGGWNRFCPEGRDGTSGRGEVGRERSKRLKVMQKMCMHAHKCNNGTYCNYSMNGRGDKGEQWRGFIQV
jgi:hypothetical protein